MRFSIAPPQSEDLSNPSRTIQSYWTETAPPERPGAPLEGDVETEVAIIGGGYTGLACALTLARDHGVQATVLEAGDIGWGASGRNGGIVSIDCTQLSLREKQRRVGEAETIRFYASQAEAVVNLRALIAEEGIACDASGASVLEVASSPRGYEEMAQQVSYYTQKLGLRARRLSRDALREESFESPYAFGALECAPAFSVHPLKLVLGIAAAAVRGGAVLHPNSAVRSWRREGRRHLLETDRGTVRARFVALATSGFPPTRLQPSVTSRALPVLSNIIVTRPLSDEQREAHGWRDHRPMYDDRNLLRYFRMLPDGRFLLGARGDVWGTETGAKAMRQALLRDLEAMFPAWADVPITHFWRGPICATLSRAPSIGRSQDDPTVLFAFGYHGTGVNSATWCGAALARLIAEGNDGEEGIPSLYRGRPPRVPFPGLKPYLVGAGLLWRGLRDRLGF
ncbi:MAG: FAD-binding oxidoreductase [Pseudomonadota bacterium]